jgi:hypothetical protein
MFDDLNDMPDGVLAQAKCLFAHLPAGEIGEGDPLHITAIGDIFEVLIDATGTRYRLFEGYGRRIRKLSSGSWEFTCFSGGIEIAQKVAKDGTEFQKMTLN